MANGQGNVSSDNDLRNKLQQLMEEAAALKKEASDERLRRIESERMARTSEDLYLNQVQQRREAEECLSKIEQEFQQLKVRQDEVSEEFQKATEHNENLQHQLTETIRALESMRGDATSASPSYLGSVVDENRIPSYFICPISQAQQAGRMTICVYSRKCNGLVKTVCALRRCLCVPWAARRRLPACLAQLHDTGRGQSRDFSNSKSATGRLVRFLSPCV